ncbi:MAG: NUDIX hydrolase [Myxococcales bacterium FL481]|nr:MAG: NUDIX hydrolase [Myxococcales bacterium FL481]
MTIESTSPPFSALDRCFHLAYTVAYRLMRVYWAVRRPATRGALVALWCNGEILLVRNSYHGYFSLPGGYVQPGESGIEAARRELKEEVGLDLPVERLSKTLHLHHVWEHKQEELEMYAVECAQPPSLAIDRREVILAEFFAPDRALELNVFPPIRRHILERLGAG